MEEQGRKGWIEQPKPMAGLPQGRLTLSVLLLGVVGEGRGLHEGHQAMLAREGPVPRVQPQVVLQRGVGRELGPALLTGEGLLIEVLCQLVVLHPWGGRQDIRVALVGPSASPAQPCCRGTSPPSPEVHQPVCNTRGPPVSSSPEVHQGTMSCYREGKETQLLLLVLLNQPQNWNSLIIFGRF